LAECFLHCIIANVYVGAAAGVEPVMACHFTIAPRKHLELAM
jgi:hypothetical protein